MFITVLQHIQVSEHLTGVDVGQSPHHSAVYNQMEEETLPLGQGMVFKPPRKHSRQPLLGHCQPQSRAELQKAVKMCCQEKRSVRTVLCRSQGILVCMCHQNMHMTGVSTWGLLQRISRYPSVRSLTALPADVPDLMCVQQSVDRCPNVKFNVNAITWLIFMN